MDLGDYIVMFFMIGFIGVTIASEIENRVIDKIEPKPLVSNEVRENVHYILSNPNYDTLWIKYDTTITKHYSIDKPEEYGKIKSK